jgi:Fe-S cluster assembly iron-binding protein IscA
LEVDVLGKTVYIDAEAILYLSGRCIDYRNGEFTTCSSPTRIDEHQLKEEEEYSKDGDDEPL